LGTSIDYFFEIYKIDRMAGAAELNVRGWQSGICFDTLGQIIAGNSHVPFVCALNGKTYDRKGNNQARKGGLQPEPVVPVAATREVAENESAPDGG
jgi:hypothetical protein